MSRLPIAALLLLFAYSTEAQVARDGAGDARAAQQLQQLAQERNLLRAENERLTRELAEATTELAAATREARDSEGRAGRQAAELTAARAAEQAAERNAAQLRSRVDELVARFRDTAETLMTVEAERNRLDSESRLTSRRLEQCEASNTELFLIAEDVLRLYEEGGALRTIGRAEPFTRLVKTRIENLADEYRDRAADLRLERAADGADANSQRAP